MMYRFTAKLAEVECGVETAALVERIYGLAGDATCHSQNGVVWVAFDREASSLEQAFRSAIGDIVQAGSRVASVELDQEELSQFIA